ncbi:MAG: methyltransferase [Acidimicrobiales bacterium]|nr:methyltransferase [Acidimicrobiales bacterium]
MERRRGHPRQGWTARPVTMTGSIWTEFAHSYDEVMPELRCYQGTLSKILRDTADRPYVVDVGCGTGLVGQALVERGHRVSGFDNNPAMLSLAHEKRNRLEADARVRWELMDGSAEGYPAAIAPHADAVVLNKVLLYVRDVGAALHAASGILRPGGIVIITGPKPGADFRKVLEASIDEWQAEARWTDTLQAAVAHHVACGQRVTSAGDVAFFEPDGLVARLREHGFSDLVAVDRHDYHGQNFYISMTKQGSAR